MSVIANFVGLAPEEVTQSAGQLRMRIISQLIKSIWRVHPKLLKYFNGTAVLTSFVFPSAGAFPVVFIFC